MIHSISKADINFFQSLPAPTSDTVEIWKKEGEHFVYAKSTEFKRGKDKPALWLRASTQIQGNALQCNTEKLFQEGGEIYRICQVANETLSHNEMLEMKNFLKSFPVSIKDKWITRFVVERKLGDNILKTQGLKGSDFFQFALESSQKENLQYVCEKFNCDQLERFQVHTISFQNGEGIKEEISLKSKEDISLSSLRLAENSPPTFLEKTSAPIEVWRRVGDGFNFEQVCNPKQFEKIEKDLYSNGSVDGLLVRQKSSLEGDVFQNTQFGIIQSGEKFYKVRNQSKTSIKGDDLFKQKISLLKLIDGFSEAWTGRCIVERSVGQNSLERNEKDCNEAKEDFLQFSLDVVKKNSIKLDHESVAEEGFRSLKTTLSSETADEKETKSISITAIDSYSLALKGSVKAS
jgi:hypothetical protein